MELYKNKISNELIEMKNNVLFGKNVSPDTFEITVRFIF